MPALRASINSTPPALSCILLDVKEISVSGTATTDALDMLLENIMGEAEGSASGVYTFASNAGVQSVGKDDTGQEGT